MSSVTAAPAATARRGFDSQEQETEVTDLALQGNLPSWLQGSY